MIAVDRERGGCAAGGVRIRSYPDRGALEEEARSLARAMTRKAALADLPCGGAKVVVRATGGAGRSEALARLGEAIEARRGALYVGPDFGFEEDDRLAMARTTRYVDDPPRLGDLDRSTAIGVRESIAAALGAGSLRGARVGILGLGKVGRALAALLVEDGAAVLGYDPDPAAAAAGKALGVEAATEGAIVEGDLDAVAPCALGGWLDEGIAARMRTRAVAGSANNVLASAGAGLVLARRGIALVPDLVSSAGAFIHWAGVMLDGLTPAAASERARDVGPRARALLARARALGLAPDVLAIEEADRAASAWRDAPRS